MKQMMLTLGVGAVLAGTALAELAEETTMKAEKVSEIVLVKDGQPACTLVVPAAPGPAWFAAGELKYHLKLITGADVPVVKDGTSVSGLTVQVGMTTAAKAAGLTRDSFKLQEYTIRFTPTALFVCGRDPVLDDQQAGAELKLDQKPGWYTEMGTLYAAYDLLERYAGVRWYFPTEEGMSYTPTKTLALAAKDLRRVPDLELRQNPGSGQPTTWGTVSRACTSDEQDLHMLRLKMGGKNWLIGHSFEGFPDRFWEKNPANAGVWESERKDYFALKANGMRDAQQMCFSSTGLIAQVVKDARDYFDGKGLKFRADAGPGYYTIGPRDTESDMCKCPDCVAKISKANWPFFTSGKCSELVWGFVNEVSKEVRKTHPQAKIACFGYFDYAYYPTNVSLDTNAIYSGSCLHTANWWAPATEKNDMACYRGWVDKLPRGGQICVWMYQCFPWENGQTTGFKVFPSWHAHTIARQMKMFAADGIRGIFVCGQVTHYIDGYLTIKMMDDASIDVDQALGEFFKRYYGAAAEPMQQLYLAMEKVFMGTENYPESIRNGTSTAHQTEEFAWKYLGTAERMEQFGKLLAEAKAKADSELARKHVATFEKDIWKHMLDGKSRWDVKVKYADEVEKLKNSPPPVLGKVPAVKAPADAGNPTQVDWSKAVVAKVDRGVDGYPVPGRDVTIRLLHDGTYFYMQIREAVDFGALQNAGYFGDRWEVFFAKQRAEPYRQFGLMPDGEVRNHAFGQEESWPGGARRIDTKEGGIWTINLSVPIANLSKDPVKPGDKLYMNFIRATSKGVQPVAYSPLFQTGFHCLPRLAEVTLE